MVKGVSRRVVVVHPEGSGLFEQAIFLVRDQTAARSDIVREACRIADRYLAVRTVPHRRSFTARQLAAAFAAGVLLSAGGWAAVWLFC